MKIAAIDLGTNTFLCLIAEVDGKSLKVLDDKARVVRLGENVHSTKRFGAGALTRATLCLDEFASLIKKHQVQKVIATATSAARDVTNGKILLDLGLERGIPISIIEGKKEAQLSFDGAISGVPNSKQMNILVVDVGGGSTELIFRKAGEENLMAQSFDVGCVRLTEMFLKKDPLDKYEYQNLVNYASSILKGYGSPDPDLIIAVAGTPTTLASIAQKIDFDESRVEGFILTREKINELIERLGSLPLSERKKVKGLEPLRADVIIAGGGLLLCALELVKKNEMKVSTRGLRFGAALHHEEFR